MRHSGNNKQESCGWSRGIEVLGVILIILATLLTIFTLKAGGIIMLFLVGFGLCIHRHLCHCCSRHHHHCDSAMEHTHEIKTPEKVVRVSKRTKKGA